MYEARFGFTHRPFALAPDADVIYWTRRHRLAAENFEVGVHRQAPITLITGDVGAGKTTLVQRFLAAPPDGLTIGLLSYLAGDRGDLCQWVLMAFDRDCPDGSATAQLRALQKFVLDEYSAGRRSVLILDEAQSASDEILEGLRQLTNINTGKHTMLMLILVGQPQLRERLMQPQHSQIVARIGADFHLGPMSREETAGYVAHRLRLAGGPADLFDADALHEIHDVAGGIPRATNVLCDLCLSAACRDGDIRAEARHVRAVLAEARENGTFANLAGRPGAAPDGTGPRPSPVPDGGAPGSRTAPAAPGVVVDLGERRGTPSPAQGFVVAPQRSAPSMQVSALAMTVSSADPSDRVVEPEEAQAAKRKGAEAEPTAPRPDAEAPLAESDGAEAAVAKAAESTEAAPRADVRAAPTSSEGDSIRILAVRAMASLADYIPEADPGGKPKDGAKVARTSGKDEPRKTTGNESDGPILRQRDDGAPLKSLGRRSRAVFGAGALLASGAAVAVSLTLAIGRDTAVAPASVGGGSDAAVRQALAVAPSAAPPAAAAVAETEAPDSDRGGGPASSVGVDRPTAAEAELRTVAAGLGDSAVELADVPTTSVLPAIGRPVTEAEDLYQVALDLAFVDTEAAAVSFARAAIQGHGRAAYYLGQLYETGDGVPLDLALARAWYEAASADVRGAQRRLSALKAPDRTGSIAAPHLLSAVRVERGVVELVWTSAEGPDPGGYVVELAADPRTPPLLTERLPLSAARLTVPDGVAYWRVRAIASDPAESAFSGWQRIAS